MAEPSPDKLVVSIIGSLIGAAVGWLPGGLTGAMGSPLTGLLAAVGGISGLIFSLMYKRYIGLRFGPLTLFLKSPCWNGVGRVAEKGTHCKRTHCRSKRPVRPEPW